MRISVIGLHRVGIVTGLLGMGAVPAASQGQSGPLVTDRPDQTESASIVSPGFVQFELGWTFAEDADGVARLRVHTVPGALARIGLTSRLEGRLGFGGWMRSTMGAGSQAVTGSGIGDLDAGLKVKLVDGSETRPEVALVGTLTLPTGEEGFGSEQALPTFRAAFGHTLSEQVSLGYNVGAQWSSAGSETLVDMLYSVVFGFALNERVGAFTEAFGTIALEDAGASRHALDGGFTYRVRDNLQFDVSAGVALNDAADDWFLGAGLSVRVPH